MSQMKIVANDSAKDLVEEHYDLIYKFITEHLGGSGKVDLLENLTIRIEQQKGNREIAPGYCKVGEDIYNPLIILYEDAIKAELPETYFWGCTFDQFRMHVLFHELSHLVNWLSDSEGNKTFFKSNELQKDSPEESVSNELAERYLRLNGFLGDLRCVYCDPI
jgi:hypothetical protein